MTHRYYVIQVDATPSGLQVWRFTEEGSVYCSLQGKPLATWWKLPTDIAHKFLPGAMCIVDTVEELYEYLILNGYSSLSGRVRINLI